MILRAFPVLATVFGAIVFFARAAAAEIHVFAAASLSDSLKVIGAQYEKRAGDKPVFNFGASSFLARQIEQGAPADLFFSADEARMDALEREGLILPETRKSRLSNLLVVVAAADSPWAALSPADLAGTKVKHLSLADPDTVPAGIYAREYLRKIRVWPVVEPKIVRTDNVRAALAAVESGNVEAGIVYKTDAAISRKVKIVYEVPPGETPGISYPMAVLKEAKQVEASKAFWRYLGSEEAGRVFLRFGFIVRP